MSVGPVFRRRLLIALGAAIVLPVLLAGLAHIPLVRGAVLRYATALVEERYSLRLDATRLDYNLATLRVGLADLRVSALRAPEEPFVTADYLSVSVPWRTLLGDVAFNEISATNARVSVRRREDGTSNLPTASGAPGGEPAPLRVQRLYIPQLALDLRDEQTVMSLWVPSLALLLTPDEGYIRIDGEAELNSETQATRISELDGQASFDGRALHLGNLELKADEGSARVDGSLTILARDPAADLTVRGTLDATRVARWAIVNGDLPLGSVAFEARTSGPFDALDTMLSVKAERLSWQAVSVTDLAGRTRITTDAADIQELGFGFESGRGSATGVVPFHADARGRLRAELTNVDIGAATRALAPNATLVPSGRLSAELNAEGPGIDTTRWSATARLAMTPGGNARGRISVAGNASMELRNRNWQLDGRSVIGGVTPVQLALRGNLDDAIDGTMRVADTDVPALVAVLDATGLVDVQRDVITAGAIAGEVRIAGDLRDPTIEGSAVLRNAVTAQIAAGSIRADISGRPLQRQLEFDLEAPEARAAGQPLSDIRAKGRLTGSELAVDQLTAHQPSASGQLTANGTYDIDSGRYATTFQGTEWYFAPTEDLPAAATVDLRFAGDGTTASPRGAGEVTLRDTMWGDVSVGGLTASVELDGDAAHITARAPEFGTIARARVDLQSPYATSVDAEAAGLDLAHLATLADITERVTGTAAMMLHAELPLQTWRSGSATLDVASLDAQAGDLPVRLSLPARIRYEGDRAYIERLELVAGDVAVSASGSLPLAEPTPDAAVLLTATGNIDQVVRTAAQLGLTQLPVTGGDGFVALLSRVTGSIQQPVVAADLEVGPASVAVEGLPRVTDVVLRAHAGDGWIELREAAAQYEGGQLTATGKAPLAFFSERLAAASGATAQVPGADGAVIHARATNLTPAVLAPLAEPGTFDELSGSIDMTLDAASPTLELADLTGEILIDRFDLDVAGLPVTQRIPTRIVARDGFARIEAWEWVGEGTTFTVRGQVRLEDREAAILAGGGVDLRLLTPFVRTAGLATAGRLEPRLSITGALDNPRIDGDIVVTDGALRLSDPRVIVSDLAMRAVVSRTTAQVTQLTGSLNGGALTGDGSVEYSAERGFQAQLSTSVRAAALEYPAGLRSELDADLSLSFQARPGAGESPSGRLSGTVTVLRGAYREPMAVVTGLLATLQTQQLAASAGSAGALEALALDVRVITDEDVLVDNNYARVQLGADLRLIGTAAAPALSGRADLREGGQLFVGRNVYTVNFGAIDFTNPVVIEPILNVEATTRAGGEDIEVTLSGSAQSPSVELRSTSNPDLGQVEIASLLLTGRPLDNLSSADATFIGTQVLGNFSAEALGFASRAVGLDTLRLGGVEGQTLRRDPTELATTREDPTNRITFGKSLTSNLDLTFSQSLRDGDAQTWIVDYLPKRGLELRIVSDDDDLLSSGFRHDLSFGTGGRSRPPRPRPAEVLVARVDVSGDLGLAEGQVRDALRLEPGDRFDFGEWQDDLDRVEELYRSEGYLGARIAARREETAEGVALTYSIAAGLTTRINVTGIDLDANLRERLETAWVESVFDGFLIEEAGQIVRDDLARRGYLQPNISVRLLEEAAQKTLQIDVEPGVRITGVTVRIDGVVESLAMDITAHLNDRGLIHQAISQPDAVADEVATYLRARGYAYVQAAAGPPSFTDETAVLPIRVDPGTTVTVGGIGFEGARTLAEATLREAAALDQEIPYDPAAVEAARGRLVALYRREGFASAAVAARSNPVGDGSSVEITFVIEEGLRQVLGEVSLAGNRGIDPDVILRALDLPIGEPLRADALLQARSRVFETGLFRRVDVTVEAGDAPSTAERVMPMHLRITVEEWPAVRLRYGFVVAEERPQDNPEGRELVPGLSVDLVRRTLFGRAVAVGSALTMQRREQGGRVFLNAPTFFGLPLGSSFIAERSRETRPNQTLITTGTTFTWEQRARMAGNLDVSYAYRFSQDHTFDTNPLVPPELRFNTKIARAWINTTQVWDTRDDPADTSRGLFVSSSFDFAPEALGSDYRFSRELIQAYYFRPWRSAVLASAARAGFAVPMGLRVLSPGDGFRTGGSRTVRGVGEDSLGPSDFFGPVDGESMLVFNQEIRLPLYRWIKGVAFLDAGNVFARPRDTSLRDLVGSVGFGLRVETPFALLRVDYGKSMWGRPSDSGRWSFGIGQIF